MKRLPRRMLLAGSVLAGSRLWAAAEARDAELQEGLARLERRHGGRLGVALLDETGGRRISRRGDERFALCSTSKFLAAAFVLARVDRGQEQLTRRIIYGRDSLLPHSPVTAEHVGGHGLAVGTICEAALTLSDNTAANLLLDSFGGPAALTAHFRSLGDAVTRLDRRETALNEARPGDARDTTTPVAMLEHLRGDLLGTALSAASRKQLTSWLVASRTGTRRLRAGFPEGWRAGDKTGSGGYNTTNDIAILWPPGRAPLLVAAYYAEARASDTERDAVLSEVGRLISAI